MADPKPWAQLVSVTDLSSDPVQIENDVFTFGRAKNCDMTFTGNKMVSSNHCKIERQGSKVWIYDSSTNGTLVNLRHKVHKSKHQLKHGDEIHIIYKKNEPDVNVGYVFQDLEELEKEDSSEQTLEYSSDHADLDQTQEMEQDVEEADTIDGATGSPKSALSFIRKRTLDENDNTTEEIPKTSSSDSGEPSAKVAKLQEDKKEEKDEEKVVKVPSLDTAAANEGWGAGAKKAVAVTTTSDPYEDTLVCSICQDVFHDAVSLQPCMHSFCGGCYSDWMTRSRECPTCRKKVERISKNHLVNNMAEAYLRQNPDKSRSEEDKKELDAKNKITENMKFPTNLCTEAIENSSDDDDHSDSGPFSDSDSDSPQVLYSTIGPIFNTNPNRFGFGTTHAFGTGGAQVYVPPTVCRTCPTYRGRIDHATAVIPLGTQSSSQGATSQSQYAAAANSSQSADDPGEGTSSGATGGKRSLPDVKIMADAPGYVCYAGQNHVICQCCFEPMPDLRSRYKEDTTDTDIRPMQCKICDRAYCHAFWGCRKSSCCGCINKFKDLTFDPSFWKTIILNNNTESAILKTYADENKMTLRDLLQECCERLDSKKYKFNMPVFNMNKITSNSSICYGCGQRLLADLAVQYRMDIPKEDLPDAAKNRPDCYWGKNCRTQLKPHHAQNYNHMCEQTRF